MTPLTDDELGELLTETFRRHERLADPDRATAIAVSARPRPRHVARAVLGAAAAVALVAGGTAYGLTRGSGPGAPDAGPSKPTASHTPMPPLPPPQTDAGNRAHAADAARLLALRLPVHPGARRSGPNQILVMQGLLTSGPPANTVTRTQWWTVPGGDPQAVARWYAAHPPRGFRSPGGVNSSTSSGPDQATVTAYAADYVGLSGDSPATQGVSAEVETMAVPGGTVVRASVLSIWDPARPRTSFVQDVRSIHVRVVETHYGERVTHHARSLSITDPAQVLRVATVFDSLPGYPPYVHSCPLILASTAYGIVFHTATGDVVGHYDESACTGGMTVTRDGHQVGPALGDVTRLLPLLHP